MKNHCDNCSDCSCDIKGKQIGTVRNLDVLGRICLPKEFRDVLEMNTGDSVEIFLYENGIFIKK